MSPNEQRVRDFEELRPKWDVFIKTSSRGSEIYVEEEGERVCEPEVEDDSKTQHLLGTAGLI